MHQLERLQDLVGLIYDGVLDPTAWQTYMERFAVAVGGAALGLTLRFPRGDDLGLMYTYEIDPAAGDSYQRYFYHRDIFDERTRNLPVGTYGTQAALGLDIEAITRSEIFNDWMQPQGIVEAPSMTAVLARDASGRSAAFAVLRPKGAREYGSAELELLGALVPHLRRAVAMRAQLGTATAESGALADALEHAPAAIVILDRRGRVRRANRRAEALFAAADGCTVRDGALVASHPDDNAALHAAIGAALRHGAIATDDVAPIVLARPSQRRALRALVTPLADVARAGWHAEAAAAVFFVDPEALPSSDAGALRTAYGLTPAQAHLALLLAGGASLEEAGAVLGVTIHTVRAHLKQVFAKTGARRQAALVRLVLAGAPAQK